MAIKLDTKNFNAIRQIINSSYFNALSLRDVSLVCWYLHTVKEYYTAEWVENNKILYLQGLLEGFEVDNTQASQLRDIHRNIYK